MQRLWPLGTVQQGRPRCAAAVWPSAVAPAFSIDKIDVLSQLSAIVAVNDFANCSFPKNEASSKAMLHWLDSPVPHSPGCLFEAALR